VAVTAATQSARDLDVRTTESFVGAT
jgi:hypothetical protein